MLTYYKMSRHPQYKNIGSFGNEDVKTSESSNDNKTVFEFHSSEEKNKFIKSSGNSLVVVDIYADWCAPCKNLYPQYVNLSQKYKTVLFCKENIELELTPGITAVPTFLFFLNGKNVVAANYTGGDINEVERRIKKFFN